MGSALTLPLKGEYFDQIKAGTKPEEYRLATDFWATRIAGREYASVVLTRGYPKGGGIEGETRLTRQWRGYRTTWIKHPHFGPDAVQVFAIDVSHPLGEPDMTDSKTLGRFGHHPDPAFDFCHEVECCESDAFDLRGEVGVHLRGALLLRIERAMTFRVGGDQGCVAAKQSLRELEQAMKEGRERQHVDAVIAARRAAA